ncbi:MAG: enoyl-CoA hydratase-related protein [Thermodesulfobacteriota bacterium]|nr:enoyl-CoA hydratase-related protein [Thermodesulfobacteriota bacterium]
MEYEAIKFETEDNIAIITLTRPKAMNAIGEALIKEFNDVVPKIESDSNIRAVIITGGKDIFAAGADIKFLNSLESPVDTYDICKKDFPTKTVYNMEKPTIAAIGGLAFGGGCELALSCDIRIASDSAKIGLPEVGIGVIPGGGGTQWLPRLVGTAKAMELILLGDPVDADEALRIGLVNKVVPTESLLDEAKKMAKKIAKKPAVAVKLAKLAVKNGTEMDIDKALDLEAKYVGLIFTTEDKKEGLSSFVEKRKPVFKHK